MFLQLEEISFVRSRFDAAQRKNMSKIHRFEASKVSNPSPVQHRFGEEKMSSQFCRKTSHFLDLYLKMNLSNVFEREKMDLDESHLVFCIC